MTKGSSKGRTDQSSSDHEEIVFVVDVSSFTERGFLGRAAYHGAQVDIEFDDRNTGLVLTPEMSKRLHARQGSRLKIVVDTEIGPQVAETVLKKVGEKPRISDEKVYYHLGREGGGILRLRKS
jgi:hypothetical protein